MIILSNNPLDAFDLLKVRQILRQSRCPHESLRNSFDRYAGLIDGKIFFDDALRTWHDIAARFKGKDFAAVVRELDACPQIILTVI